jgi:hypothetical protein
MNPFRVHEIYQFDCQSSYTEKSQFVASNASEAKPTDTGADIPGLPGLGGCKATDLRRSREHKARSKGHRDCDWGVRGVTPKDANATQV